MADVVECARELLAGITPGEWEVRPSTDDRTVTAGSVHSGHRSILVSQDGYHFGYADRADAEFIAAAPQLVAELADEVERLGDLNQAQNGYNAQMTDERDEARAKLKARTIESIEQLDALPNRSVVRASNGHAYEKSMLYTMVGRRWFEAGNGSPERAEDIPLPATLLWHPERDV